MHLFIVPFAYLFCSFVMVKSSLEAKWKIVMMCLHVYPAPDLPPEI